MFPHITEWRINSVVVMMVSGEVQGCLAKFAGEVRSTGENSH